MTATPAAKPPKNNNVYAKTCMLDSMHLAEFEELGIPVNQRVKHEGVSFLKTLPDHSVPCCFFDPQYRGVLDKMNYGNEGARQIGRATLTQMDTVKIGEFIYEIDRVLVPSGHLFLWIDKFHLVEGITDWFESTELNVVDLITWNKERFGMGYRSRRMGEYLAVLQKSPKRAKGVWSVHNIPDVWSEKQMKDHPHSKPIKLQSALIEAVTRKGDVVLDPAAGSFSVMKSAYTVGRHFVGCDLEG